MLCGTYGAQIAQFVDSLVRVEDSLQSLNDQSKDKPLIPERARSILGRPLEFGEPLAKTFGLRTVLTHIERIESEERVGVTPRRAAELLRGLVERLIEELHHCYFLYLGFDPTETFTKPWARWGNVPEKFPSARFDISEAGKCLVFDRGTAAVFHLMRVLERGLRALGEDLKVPVSLNPNWSEQLDLIEKRVVKQMPPSDPKAKDRKFYQEAVMQFRLFKDAVRNFTMHELVMYNAPQAEGHYRAVSEFMQHLATRLKEA